VGGADAARPDPTTPEWARDDWTGDIEVVFLVRHGETEWNRLGRRQGQLDSPLTADGRRQAERVASAATGLSVDGVFSSPLGRAVATARVCERRLGQPVTVVDELAEVHHGRMAGLTTAEIDRAFPGRMALRAANPYEWCFPGGESYADADRRAAVALRRIAATRARRPLIVSHEMIGRMLLRTLLGADPATALAWSHPHDVVYGVDVAGRTLGELRVDRAGGDDGGPG
jgi:probable phosphoglycerate mutase